METIQRPRGKFTGTWTVYTKDEADEQGIVYKHWSKANPGEMALSDDGYVGECLFRKEHKDKRNRVRIIIKTCYGVQWYPGSSKLLFEPNRAAHRYCYIKPRNWAEQEMNKTRTKTTVMAYVTQLLSNNQIDWDLLGRIYRPDQLIPRATVRRLFKEERIMEMVEEKLKEVLSKNGVNQDYVIKTVLEAIDIARGKGDVSGILRATENFMDLLEMKPSKKVITDTIEIDMTRQIADKIATEENKLKLGQRVEQNEPKQP